MGNDKAFKLRLTGGGKPRRVRRNINIAATMGGVGLPIFECRMSIDDQALNPEVSWERAAWHTASLRPDANMV